MTAPRKTALGTQVLSIACSADGRFLRVTRIARSEYTGIIELDAATLAEVDASRADWLPVASLNESFSTRTRRWTAGEFGQGLFVERLDGKLLTMPPPFNTATELTVTAFAISADERWAMVGSASGFVSVFDAASGAQRWAARQHKGHVTAVCFSPDGQLAYSGNANGELCVVDLPA